MTNGEIRIHIPISMIVRIRPILSVCTRAELLKITFVVN